MEKNYNNKNYHDSESVELEKRIKENDEKYDEIIKNLHHRKFNMKLITKNIKDI